MKSLRFMIFVLRECWSSSWSKSSESPPTGVTWYPVSVSLLWDDTASGGVWAKHGGLWTVPVPRFVAHFVTCWQGDRCSGLQKRFLETLGPPILCSTDRMSIFCTSDTANCWNKHVVCLVFTCVPLQVVLFICIH